jgi:plasmid replication initiation protein
MSQRKRLAFPPELMNKSIIQSNRVSEARYDFSLIQQKVFVWIMYHLQERIQEVIDGKHVEQLSIFAEPSATVAIEMPLNLIARHEQYNAVREALKQLATIAIELADHQHKKTRFTGLFAEINIDTEKQRTRNITVIIRRDVAKALVAIDKREDGRLKMYTKYRLQVAIISRNKYTYRIYVMLNSWRERGYWIITLEEFRSLFQLGDKLYPNYNDLKKRLIMPAIKELDEIGDFSFTIHEETDGRKVKKLKFVILEPTTTKERQSLIQNIRWLMKTQLNCTDKDCDKINPIFPLDKTFKKRCEEITDELSRLHQYIVKNQTNIRHAPAVVVAALLKKFASE